MPAVYFPILVMLLGLIFRGVAFEFRFGDASASCGTTRSSGARWSRRSRRARARRVRAGLPGRRPAVRRRQLRLVRRRSRCSTGVGLVVRLRPARRELAGDEDRGRAAGLGAPRRPRCSLFGVLAFIAMVSIWTPLIEPQIAARWFAWPNLLLLRRCRSSRWRCSSWLWRALDNRGREAAPFFAAMGLFALCYLGLGISLAEHRAAHDHAVGRGGLAAVPGVPAGRHAVPAADHPHVHRLVLLGVPRQGKGGNRLSLKRPWIPKPSDLPDDAAAEAPRPRPLLSAAPQPGGHRGDTIDAGEVGDVLLKFAVVLLSSINAVLWEVYTEAPFMAAAWAAIAVWFLVWMLRAVRNR